MPLSAKQVRSTKRSIRKRHDRERHDRERHDRERHDRERCEIHRWQMIDQFPLCRLVFLLSLFFCSLNSFHLTASAEERTAEEQIDYESSRNDQQIAKLVNQLDAIQFSARESATEQLTKMGGLALRQLALRAIECSPESAWRIKQTLESIGVRGSEAEFYQAVSILRLLYTDGSQSLDARFSELQLQWKLEQKKSIIQRLSALGAVVSDPAVGRAAFNGNPVQQMVVNGRVVNIQGGVQFFGNGEFESVETQNSSIQNPGVSRKTKLDSAQTVKQIDKILLASLAENRDSLFEQTDQLTPSPATENPENRELQLRVAMLQRRNMFNRDAELGISVKLSDKWQGDASDLKSLHHLLGLTTIELVNTKLSTKQLAELANLQSILILKIEGESNSATNLQPLFSKLPQLRELEIKQRKVDDELIKACISSPSLMSVNLINCDIQPDALQKLNSSNTIRSLSLTEMQIESWMFRELEQLDRLTYLNLSLCKFETAAYQRLTKNRPTLQILYTPQAFLGVRGDFNLENACTISSVVPGSGADKGGLKMGDHVTHIDGQPIAHFEDLRLHVAQHRPGEKLTVEVLRNEKPLKLEIELSQFDQNLE